MKKKNERTIEVKQNVEWVELDIAKELSHKLSLIFNLTEDANSIKFDDIKPNKISESLKNISQVLNLIYGLNVNVILPKRIKRNSPIDIGEGLDMIYHLNECEINHANDYVLEIKNRYKESEIDFSPIYELWRLNLTEESIFSIDCY